MENMIASAIKSSVTMREVCDRYGIPVNSRGYALCPFHSEKSPSFLIYPGKGGYHCFGCGAHGDVIRFVEDYFGESFKDAAKRLNNDFQLGLDLGGSNDAIKDKTRRKGILEAAMRRERVKKELDEADADYWTAFDLVKRLNDIVEARKPTYPTDELDPLYVMAEKCLPQYEEDLERAEIHRKEILKKWNELTA